MNLALAREGIGYWLGTRFLHSVDVLTDISVLKRTRCPANPEKADMGLLLKGNSRGVGSRSWGAEGAEKNKITSIGKYENIKISRCRLFGWHFKAAHAPSLCHEILRNERTRCPTNSILMKRGLWPVRKPPRDVEAAGENILTTELSRQTVLSFPLRFLHRFDNTAVWSSSTTAEIETQVIVVCQTDSRTDRMVFRLAPGYIGAMNVISPRASDGLVTGSGLSELEK